MIPLNLPSNPVPDRYSIIAREGKLPPHTRKTYVEFSEPGCIQHIHFVANRDGSANRGCILRIYFDGSEIPHVEVPLGDFFGVMHGLKYYPINTPHLSVQEETGYNCYFSMPFAKSARVELESGEQSVKPYIQIDWHRYPGRELCEPRRFCARWRRECLTERYGRDFLAFDADGPGDLIGFVYGIRLYDDTDRWSHGGAENFYGDGDGEIPFYVRGLGGEDTFGTSFGGAKHPPETHLYTGIPYYHHDDVGTARVAQRVVGYRFFERDSIHFERSLHFRFGCMANDICATTYWYQEGSPRPYFRMPEFPKMISGVPCPAGEYDLPLPETGQWWLCGPFRFSEGKAFLAELPAESGAIDPGVAIDVEHEEGSAYLGEAAMKLGRNKARWVQAEALRNFVDFNHYFRCAAKGPAITYRAVAIARCVLQAPRTCQAKLRLAWDDQALLRVNGEGPLDLGTHAFFRSCEVNISLKEGENTIAIKLSNTSGTNHGAWSFVFHCETETGECLLPQTTGTDTQR